jgi:hypoxanthine phosphoribosyltransferase
VCLLSWFGTGMKLLRYGRIKMLDSIERVLVSRETIREKTRQLGQQISQDYKDKELVLVGVLKGGFVFLADLMREITIPVDMDFMAVSSYGKATTSSGVVRIIKDIDIDITDKHVLIVEDIIDTGLTLNHLKELLYKEDRKV